MFRVLVQAWQTFCVYILWPFITCFIAGPLAVFFLSLRLTKLTHFIINIWGKSIFFLLGQPYFIQGLENIDPNHRYIIISNHSSMFDIPLIAALMPTSVSWVMKESLLKIPVLNILFLLGIGIPISRTNARESKEKMMLKTHQIKQKINPNIIIYPEGTRTKNGSINSFKRGFIQLMREYEMDILPLTLSGVYEFQSYKHRIPNPTSKLRITVHPIQKFETLEELDDKVILQKMYNLITEDYYA